ncbi:chemotaxis protein CheW [Sphingomonas sp. 1P06PA]|uniref:chemotaxis protein CheW n=1 Tax=Sphingomonas sp. 1P06PA TaxID=554121 RepID=UPI0039A4C0B9
MSDTGDITITDDVRDAEGIARLLAERQAVFAAPPAAADAETILHLRWSIGDARFASPIAAIREVAPLPRATPVPGAPAALLGIVAWRGLIANLFDPAAALGVERAESRHMVVLANSAPLLALAVSGVDAAIAVPVDHAVETDAALAHIITLDGSPISLVSTTRLAERLIARRTHREG